MLVQLAESPIDRIQSEALILFYNKKNWPPTGHVGLVDWRMSGQVSRLVVEKKLSGVEGEVFMLPTRGRLIPGFVFLFGISEKPNLSTLRKSLFDTVKRLHFKEIAVGLITGEGKELEFWRKLGEDLQLNRLVAIPPTQASKVACEKMRNAMSPATL